MASVFDFARTKGPAGWDLGGLAFAKAIEGAVPGVVFKVACKDTNCKVTFERDLDATEEANLQTTVANFTRLDEVKARRYAEIDARSQEIIVAGFEFPPSSGQRFSLSTHAQNTLIGMKTLLGTGMLTFPIEWNTIDDGALFSVPDEATADSFYLTAVATVRGALDSGTVLKSQIRAATDIAAVMAIVDPR